MQCFNLVFLVVVVLQLIFKVVYGSTRGECPAMAMGSDVSPAYTENTEVKSCFS